MRDKSGEPSGSDQKTLEVEPSSPTKQQQPQPQSQKTDSTSDAERLQMIVFIIENFKVTDF